MGAFDFDPLKLRKGQANAKILQHYSRIAMGNAHMDMIDLVKLQKGEITEHPVERRHAEMMAKMVSVENCNCMKDIEEVEKTLGVPNA